MKKRSPSSFLGMLFGSWRQPAVKTTEHFNIETQWYVPILKVLGIGLCALAVLLSLWFLGWTVPPAYRYDAMMLLGSAAGIVSTTWGCIVLFKIWQRGGEITYAPLVYCLAISACIGVLTFVGIKNSDNWWLEPLHDRTLAILRIFLFGLLASGLFGFYHFAKEIAVPFELTGLDKVIRDFIALYGDDFVNAELDAMGYGAGVEEDLRAYIEELEAELGKAPEPLIRTDTLDGRRDRLLLRFKLAVAQFLFVGALTTFARKEWVDVDLAATGITMTDALWRHLCSGGGELRVRERPVLVVEGRSTVLNLQYSPQELIGMAMKVKPPQKWMRDLT